MSWSGPQKPIVQIATALVCSCKSRYYININFIEKQFKKPLINRNVTILKSMKKHKEIDFSKLRKMKLTVKKGTSVFENCLVTLFLG